MGIYRETDDNLMVRFKLNESSGTSAADSSGNGRTGTLANFTNTTTCWVGGRRGGGLDFGQGSDDTCTFAFTDPGNFTTMMAFVRWDSDAGTSPRIIHLGNNMPPYQLMYFDATNKQLRFGLTFAGGAQWFRTASDTVDTDSVWRHLAVTYDASDYENNPIFYINGEVSATSLITRTSGARTSLTTNFGALGQVYNATNRGLDGVISDARVYNRILTQQEISRVANFREPETYTQSNFSDNFVINKKDQLSSQQYTRDDGTITVDEVPFSLGIKGPINLRGRRTAYKVTK